MLWQGRPDGRLRFRLTSHDGLFLFVVGFILSAATFAVVASAFSMLSERGSLGGLLAALTIAILAAAIGVQPALNDKRRRGRYRYAVTNQRALRLDAKTDHILTERPIMADTLVDLIGRTPKTVRIGQWAENGRPIWAEMPDSRNYMQPTGDGWIAGMFERRQTLKASIPSQGFKTGGDGIQSYNGYDDVGLEFRMIKDAEKVAALLRRLVADNRIGTP